MFSYKFLHPFVGFSSDQNRRSMHGSQMGNVGAVLGDVLDMTIDLKTYNISKSETKNNYLISPRIHFGPDRPRRSCWHFRGWEGTNPDRDHRNDARRKSVHFFPDFDRFSKRQTREPTTVKGMKCFLKPHKINLFSIWDICAFPCGSLKLPLMKWTFHAVSFHLKI